MIKELINSTISNLKSLTKFLEEVYDETYKTVENEFAERVNKIKERNKTRFIKKISTLVAMKCFSDTGIAMPEEMANMFAEEVFKEATIKGDLDMLYRFNYEHKE